ncbi:MAG: YebC/PmpR family DNA-binding transcriptional regulator [Candidatus Peribacteraceae bacterium]|nr:YebC/PmpR family DNA-binding transcriptional regulator [Candidatus Peribacteraceae bacterium]
MSGHSKWANIRVRKTAEDARRGKVFTRHARLIEIAARGGGDPTMNNTLRTAIENAREDNVPNANIERAVKKGSGGLKGEQMQEVVYECYGPGGVACIIECITDNRNRTLGLVKSIIEKRGGRWAESNAVRWMFDQLGVISGRKVGVLSEDLELQLIDAGARDIEQEDGFVSVTTDAARWSKARDILKKAGYAIESAGLKYVPKLHTDVTSVDAAKKLMEFIEMVEADDDVSEVHTNANFSDEVAKQL